MPYALMNRIKIVLAAAARLPPGERYEFARAQFPDDPGLLSEVVARLDDPASALLEPQSLVSGRYRIQELLGNGTFSRVYLAHDESQAGQAVVVKLLLDPDAGASAIPPVGTPSHPQIVALSDAGELPDGTPFLVMPYVAGETLRHLLQAGSLRLEQCRAILRDAGQALAAAHRAGIWHLDVKPENIILSGLGTPEERITLIDFGMAQLAPSFGLEGTSPYRAPEQRTAPSAQCDIHALAAVAFEMLTGEVPPSPAKLTCPRPLEAALTQALAEHPALRHASMEKFLDQALDQRESVFRPALLFVLAVMVALIVAAILFRLP